MKVSKLYGAHAEVFDPSSSYRGIAVPREVIESKRAVGIEVEVENHQLLRRTYSGVWQQHNDGSLRNNGIEYVTHPIAACHAPMAMQELLVQALNPDECCFSPRTSIHVHVDFTDEDDSSVVSTTLMYSLFEKLFFRFTGRGRIKNIYCVPVIDTNMLTGVATFTDTRTAIQVWSKYSAVNMLPVSQYGTLEFRHMHGTFDLDKVCIWIRLITKLVDWVCQKTTPKVLASLFESMDENYDYVGLLNTIFGDDAMHLKYQGFEDVEQSLGKVMTGYVNKNNASALAALRDLKSPFYLAK